jgi:NAD binding domain of 6-phosphogluconate dehydrogenase
VAQIFWLEPKNSQTTHGPPPVIWSSVDNQSQMLQPKITRLVSRRRVGLLYGSPRLLSTNVNPMRYGFVGLGQMGYPMAMNLLRKTNRESTFTIYDVNPLSLSRFVNEANSTPNAPAVTVAHNPKDLAERSVMVSSSITNERTI